MDVRWMDCVKNDMRIKGKKKRITEKKVSMKMSSDRREWKKKACCAENTYWVKVIMMMIHSLIKGTAISVHNTY
jgi:hypothetical protein